MPYYIYAIIETGPIRRLDHIAEHEVYRDAAAHLKRLRQSTEGSTGTVRLIFAENPLRAEELLSERRTSKPLIADDY
jgi:hypothetical protein